MPAGKLSVTPAPVIAVALGLVSVTVRVVTPPAPMVEGTKPLLTDGPVKPLLTAVTVMAVPGPLPSGSMVAVFTIVAPPACI